MLKKFFVGVGIFTSAVGALLFGALLWDEASRRLHNYRWNRRTKKREVEIKRSAQAMSTSWPSPGEKR